MDSYGHVMVLVPAREFEMGAEAEVVFGEFQKLVDPEYWDVYLLLSMEPVHTVNLDDYISDKEWQSFLETFDIDFGPTAYLFKCLHCN